MTIWKKPWFIPIVLTGIILVGGQLYTSGKLTKANTLTVDEVHAQLSTIYNGEVNGIVQDGSIFKAKVSKAGSEYAVEMDATSGKVLSLIQTKESLKSDIVLGDEAVERDPDLEVVVKEPEEEEPEKTIPPIEKPVKETPPPAEKTEKPKKNAKKVPAQTKPQTKPLPKPKPSNKPAKAPTKTVLLSKEQAANIAMKQLPAGMIGEVDDVDFEKSDGGGYYLVQIEIDTDDELDEVTYQIHAISGKVLTVTWDD